MLHLQTFTEFARALLVRVEGWDLSQLQAEDKADGSPVTAYDRELNTVILEFLATQFPGDSLVGEEEQQITNSPYIWYFDPIDGTKEFLQGNGQWAIQIGRVYGEEVEIGFVLHPASQQLYYAEKGAGCLQINLATGQEQRLQLLPSEAREPIALISNNDTSADELAYIQDSGITRSMAMGSFGLKLLAIARNQADVYPNFRCLIGLWDLCGPQLLLQEAGGDIYFAAGERPRFQQREGFKVERKLVAYHPAFSPRLNRNF